MLLPLPEFTPSVPVLALLPPEFSVLEPSLLPPLPVEELLAAECFIYRTILLRNLLLFIIRGRFLLRFSGRRPVPSTSRRR